MTDGYREVAIGLALATACAALGTCAHPSRAEDENVSPSSPAVVVVRPSGHAAGDGSGLPPPPAGVALPFAERWPLKDQARAPGLPPLPALASEAAPAFDTVVIVLALATLLTAAAAAIASRIQRNREERHG